MSMILEKSLDIQKFNSIHVFCWIKVMELLIFLFVTIVAIISSMYLFALSRVQYLKQHWVDYRCNPLYMPIAGLVGDDVFTNFTKCTMKGFHDYAGFMMDPIMAEFSVVNDTISEVGDAMHSIRGMMGGVRGGFLGILGTVFGKIHNVMSQFQYIIIRMRTLLSRIVGVMMSFLMVFYTGMETAGSVVNGPVGKTMSFLCFDSKTKIKTASKGKIYMEDLVLGDVLEDNACVTSIYVINGNRVEMFDIDGIHVSGSHKIKFGNTFIQVRDHPSAKRTYSSDRLVCLNTSNHRIIIKSLEFLDFTEFSHKDFLSFKRNYVEHSYNGEWDVKNKSKYMKYPSGVSENTHIGMYSGKGVCAKDVMVGDRLMNGHYIIGVAYHAIFNGAHVVLEDGIEVSPSCWVLKNAKIHSAESLGNMCKVDNENWRIIVQFITSDSRVPCISHDGNVVYILDEFEILEDYFYKTKDAIIKTGSFRGKEIVV
jgi:hypothetical protein